MKSTRAAIDDFLAQKRIALVGVSRDPQAFSRAVFRTLRDNRYDVVPVHPQEREIEGVPAYPRVLDIPDGVDGVLIMTPPKATEAVVKDCNRAGVKRVWLHRGTGRGSVSRAALAYCRENDIAVVPGECPLMFVGSPAWIHRVHAFCKKLVGSYPQ